jgi:hypothetical protein
MMSLRGLKGWLGWSSRLIAYSGEPVREPAAVVRGAACGTEAMPRRLSLPTTTSYLPASPPSAFGPHALSLGYCVQ